MNYVQGVSQCDDLDVTHARCTVFFKISCIEFHEIWAISLVSDTRSGTDRQTWSQHNAFCCAFHSSA